MRAFLSFKSVATVLTMVAAVTLTATSAKAQKKVVIGATGTASV